MYAFQYVYTLMMTTFDKIMLRNTQMCSKHIYYVESEWVED